MSPDPAPAGPLPRGERPLVVQSDGTLLLEVDGPHAAAAREAIGAFAHLERSPEYVHTYRITPLSLWNAAASGVEVSGILAALERFARYPVPDLVGRYVVDQAARFGKVRMLPRANGLIEAQVTDRAVRTELSRAEALAPYLAGSTGEALLVPVVHRGAFKQALVQLGYPAEDLCGFTTGDPLAFSLRERTRSGLPFSLRPYQEEAIAAFRGGGGPRGGAGVVVLPCGAGKTVVAMGAMVSEQTSTLILSTNTVAVHQWRDELLDKTDLTPDLIGEYTGERKDVRAVTIATYQILTHRDRGGAEFPHLELVRRAGFGLVIYDEVHMLPAPVFRVTSEIQARRRLGLTATLVREDGKEGDVFALIGPRRYELGWKLLEERGFIAEARCIEVRLELPDALRMRYALAARRDRFRLAAENPRKLQVVAELIEASPEDAILVIGQYLDQLRELAARLELPLITGQTPTADRERLYDDFRHGRTRVLVVSKVANFAIDLPDASMAIEISGTFGSRQEEAQRLGRLLRPKDRPARFFVLVSRDTLDQEFAANRQRFLVEQGYRYEILDG